MAGIPLDTQHVVDELRAARLASGAAPRYWSPSSSFDQVLQNPWRQPVHLNADLAWMHANWDLSGLLAPPPRRGLKGALRRLQHRLTMAVLAPYLSCLQEQIAASTRAIDAASRRVDEISDDQLRTIGALRHDMIDLAHYLDERLDG